MAREIRAIAAAGASAPLVEPELLVALAHEREPVVLVVDHERPGIPEVVDLGPEHARARGVEGGDQRGTPAAGPAGEDRRHALRHLAGGLVRERDGQDLPRVHAAGHQVRDPLRDDAGLAAARAGQDEQGPVHVEDRLPLDRIEPGEQRRDVGLVEQVARLVHQAPIATGPRRIEADASPERSPADARGSRGARVHRKRGADRTRAPATRPSRSSRGSAAGRRRSPGAPRRGTRGAGAAPP